LSHIELEFGLLGGHPKPAISGHLKTGHLSGTRVRDIDGVPKAFSLARHEQCLERRKTAASNSAWATAVVGAAHRGIHRGSPGDRQRLSQSSWHPGSGSWSPWPTRSHNPNP
jgi:hypothetical protein